jgi:hypothetical protein
LEDTFYLPELASEFNEHVAKTAGNIHVLYWPETIMFGEWH